MLSLTKSDPNICSRKILTVVSHSLNSCVSIFKKAFEVIFVSNFRDLAASIAVNKPIGLS